MVKTLDAIAYGRQLLGTPYSTYDCINYIKRIIRKCDGGDPGYQTAGTNTLWRSRDLTWRQESIQGAKPGMVAFKVRKDASRSGGVDVYHIGLVTGSGTVLQSSSVYGKVVETDLNSSWHYLARHKWIEVIEMAEETALYMARVTTDTGTLNVRSGPGSLYSRVGRLEKDSIVEVLDVSDANWPRVRQGDLVGYAANKYLTAIRDAGADQDPDPDDETVTTKLISDTGLCIQLVGRWSVAER